MKAEIRIHIGEYHASRKPTVIQTVLGSCVAVCLFDPVKRIGGMNHILLPGQADLKHFDVSARYGINAMELLINKMMGLGANPNRFVAKVFGGAHVIPAISRENGTGKKNTGFALEFLQKENIEVLSKNIGGGDSRKVYFHTDTADVFVKKIPPMLQAHIAKRESTTFRSIQKEVHRCGEVTLFKD